MPSITAERLDELQKLWDEDPEDIGDLVEAIPELLRLAREGLLARETVIWWLSQAEVEAIEVKLVSELPTYIQTELKSVSGRAGRGRLWVSPHLFRAACMYTWPDGPLGKYLEGCAGLVLEVQDLKFVKDLPGTITNMAGQRI